MRDTRITLRPARKTDCRVIAELAQIAGEGIPAWFWAQAAAPGEDLLDVGARNAASETENFSYRNATLAELHGNPVALLLAYRLPAATTIDTADYPAFLRPLLELEHEVPGSFYINMLACFPGFRGRGVGTQLLDHAHALAGAAGCDTLSLQVFAGNHDACRLYQRCGFRVVDRRPVIPHPSHPHGGEWLLMTRPVTG